jgi:NADP-dependent 3-hydroxy acid dehydrogenase YdfG
VNSDQTSKKGLLPGRIAVVTGASSGVGRAIAIALARQGARLALIGRNSVRLAETVAEARRFSTATDFLIDLALDEKVQSLVDYLEGQGGELDVLIHSAGIIHQGTLEQAPVEDLDRQYVTNIRVPYSLTKTLLPFLIKAGGQVVFVNSSAGLSAKRPEVGQYAATKHALKAIADSLREEVNPKGIRVLTIYLGRTATPMQEALFQQSGRDYHPGTLLQADDVASLVVHSLTLPPTAEVTDISVRPMMKPAL